MVKKIIDYINEYNMLDGCDNIIVGLSGGADSVCLIYVLSEVVSGYEKKAGRDISIKAVHINHGIRGDEAERDEMFARELAGKLGIEFAAYHYDIPDMAEKMGISEESAGRMARYECFDKEACRLGKERTKIAVAHHMDDQTETVLMHMIRGSSIEGLAGMRAVYGNVIRPLLCVSRAQIEEYLADNGILYVTDSTNSNNEYTRNMVRNCLIPDIEKINPQFKQIINNMAGDMAEYSDYLERTAADAESEYCFYRDGRAYIGSGVTSDGVDDIIIKCLIKKAYEYVHGDVVNLYRTHIEDVLRLLKKQNGKSINLPGKITAVRCQEGLVFESANSDEPLQEMSMDEIVPDIFSGDGKMELPCMVYGGVTCVEWKIRDNKDLINLQQNDYTKYFDYDKINTKPVLRFRRKGDTCVIDNAGHTKKLKQELIDRKVPAKQRDTVLLMAVRDNVLWAVGVRRYQDFLVTDNTKKILQITFY